MARSRVCFVVESGTDVRLVEGLAERFTLTILARRIPGGVEVSQPTETADAVTVGSPNRAHFAREVYRFLTEPGHRFDTVIVQGYGLAALAANLAGRRTSRATWMLVCSPVEAYYRCRKIDRSNGKRFRRSALWGLQSLAAANARLGQGYIVLSDHLARVVRQPGGHLPINVIPIYGVDTQRFAPSHLPKAVIRRQRLLPVDGDLVFFSSRVAPEKDAVTLLRAIRTLVQRNRNVRVLHRSGGFRQFSAVAQSLDIASHVIATNAVHPHDELPLDYQASDLCVQASREEGLGFSPLEALACGVPVVATAVGGLRETIRDGETGWSYPVGEVEALADCIAAALDDPEECKRRAMAGRAMVCERYERGRVFDQLEDLVEQAREKGKSDF